MSKTKSKFVTIYIYYIRIVKIIFPLWLRVISPGAKAKRTAKLCSENEIFPFTVDGLSVHQKDTLFENAKFYFLSKIYKNETLRSDNILILQLAILMSPHIFYFPPSFWMFVDLIMNFAHLI